MIILVIIESLLFDLVKFNSPSNSMVSSGNECGCYCVRRRLLSAKACPVVLLIQHLDFWNGLSSYWRSTWVVLKLRDWTLKANDQSVLKLRDWTLKANWDQSVLKLRDWTFQANYLSILKLRLVSCRHSTWVFLTLLLLRKPRNMVLELKFPAIWRHTWTWVMNRPTVSLFVSLLNV